MRADNVSIMQKTCVHLLGENRIKSENGVTKLNYNAIPTKTTLGNRKPSINP